MIKSNLASEEIVNQRLEICRDCEHNLFNVKKNAGVCAKCGCILKLKTQWKNVKCPIGKWGQVIESS